MHLKKERIKANRIDHHRGDGVLRKRGAHYDTTEGVPQIYPSDYERLPGTRRRTTKRRK